MPRLFLCAGLALLLTDVQSGLRPGEILTGDAAARVDRYLTRLVPYGYSGAVLIAQGDAVVLKKAYGLANRTTGEPYTVDMVSCIGSVTKQFTGAAIVKLEMQGRLKTTDPISQYLPEVPDDKRGITIHHLLTHTAGLPGDQGGSDEEPITRDALVARVLSTPLASTPGERFEYSNEGYSLAGAIIERVSGMGYEAFLREHLFLPADMIDTGYLAPNWPLAKLPLGYGPQGGEWGRVYKNGWLDDGPGWYLRANGGLHASLDDLYRWHLALQTAKVLSPEALAKYQGGHVESIGGERYGYGWGVQPTRRGTTVITHNGGNGFFFSDVRRYVEERTVIIAMTNQAVIPATALAPRQLEALVFGDQAVVEPPAPVPVAAEARAARAGRYALETGGSLVVRVTDVGIEAEADDPTLFGTIPGLMPPGGRFKALEERSLPLLDAAARDDMRPLYEAFRDERPFGVIEANQRKRWQAWRADFGEFQRLELVGTGLVQGDPAVTVKLHFARGGPIVQLVWGPRRLAGFGVLPGTAVARLVAESPDDWVYFAYRAPALVRLRFGSDGEVTVTAGARTLGGRRR